MEQLQAAVTEIVAGSLQVRGISHLLILHRGHQPENTVSKDRVTQARGELDTSAGGFNVISIHSPQRAQCSGFRLMNESPLTYDLQLF